MTIEQISHCRIAYVRHKGPYGAQQVQTMERLKQWAHANGLMDAHAVIYGIAQDNPQTTAPECCRYDACIALSSTVISPSDAIQIGIISGGRYSVFTVEHTAQAVGKAYGDIFPALAQRSYCLDLTRPIMERYTAEKLAQHLCEICVPIL